MSGVSITYGKVTFPKASSVIAAFVVTAPFNRVLASKALTKVGGTTRHAAGNQAMDGILVAECVEAPDGTILCLQTQKTQGGRSMADGAIFLRVRAEAPLISIRALLPQYHGSKLGALHSVFEGRADVLSVAEVQMAGIAPHSNYLRGFCKQEEVEECYAVVTLMPAISAAPRFILEQSSSGEVVALQADTRVRRMRVRKA